MKEYKIIVNTYSRTGEAKAIWEKLEAELKSQGIVYDAHITEYVGHATELAKEMTSKDEEVNLLVVGGDGTCNEVVNGIDNFEKVTVGFIPTGSGNDLGRGLGITRAPLEQLKHLLTTEETKQMDIGEVSTCEGVKRKFTISAGIGIDADVCKQALTSKLKVVLNKIGLGSLTYGLLTVHTLFTIPRCDAHLVLDDGTKLDYHKMYFTAAMNFSCEGGGVPMSPKASGYDGKLSSCSFRGLPRILCLFAFPILIAGKHESLPVVDMQEFGKMKMKLTHPQVVHADGEYCGTVDEVEFACLPGLLKIFV